MPGSPGRPSNGAGASPASSCDEDVETVGPDRDAEHRGPRCAGAVGGVGEEVTEAGEPEQAVGSGVVAERELEVGERAVRCREGDAPAGGAPHALAAPPALEGTEESDGGQAEDARPDGEGPDVVALPARGDVVSPGGLVDIVWTARGRARRDALPVRRVRPPEGCLRCSSRGCWRRAVAAGRRCGGLAPTMPWTTGAGAGVSGAAAGATGATGRLGRRRGDSVRDDEGPARVDPVGVAERSATGLRYPDVGLVDGLPLLAVAVVGGRDAPQGVTGHHGVRHRGGLCTRPLARCRPRAALARRRPTLTAELVTAGDGCRRWRVQPARRGVGRGRRRR